MRDQRAIDAQHLKLLAIFHFVLCGLFLLGLAFLWLHWFLFHTIFTNPKMWEHQKGPPPPAEIFAALQWFYVFFGGVIVLGLLANLLSGFLLWRRRHHIVSLVIAGLDCLCFPFGTVLGVFTIVVLVRESVAELYAHAGQTSAP